MDYIQLLRRAKERLPSVSVGGGRFEVPEVQMHVEGSKTIIDNFQEICDRLNRSPKHLLRFLLSSIGTKGVVEASRAVLQGVFSTELINDRVNRYVKEFVICPACRRPDTNLVKDEREKVTYLRCDACGAQYISKEV